MRLSIPTGLSLNRKLLTAPATSPFSTRYTPSLVSPVSSSVCGSTWRMYHRQVSKRPCLVEEIIDDSDGPGEASEDITRLSTGGVTGSPVSRAECRLECNAPSAPWAIQEAAPEGSPLSNTDESRPDKCATTNGAHSRPGYAGSLNSDTGKDASRSPTLVPPPGLLNTVRP